MNIKLPRYEYSRSKIESQIKYLKDLSLSNGLIVRFAVKANPHPTIIKMMDEKDVHFDASSSYEATELLEQGVVGNKISLSSQQSPHNLEELLKQGVLFVATSFKQLELFLNTEGRPDTVAVRINPDIGYGHNNRTSTGGANAGFGVWHEYIPKLIEMTSEHNVKIDRVHIHIGSGADPSVWGDVMDRSLEIMTQFKDATSLDIGGGFKIHRFGDEEEADMVEIMKVFDEKLLSFQEKTDRKISLEIEPGSYFMAHVGTLITYIDDIVDTGKNGHTFIKLNTGMNDFLRGVMYGALHKIEIMNDSDKTKEYMVIGHNCESGDIFTPVMGNPEKIQPRVFKEAKIGDEVRIYDTGAYCASMRAKGYNSFPDAEEVMVD